MIKLSIQTDAKDSVVDIIQAAIAAEIKRLEIGLSILCHISKKIYRRGSKRW
jgi:hypothetical protein